MRGTKRWNPTYRVHLTRSYGFSWREKKVRRRRFASASHYQLIPPFSSSGKKEEVKIEGSRGRYRMACLVLSVLCLLLLLAVIFLATKGEYRRPWEAEKMKMSAPLQPWLSFPQTRPLFSPFQPRQNHPSAPNRSQVFCLRPAPRPPARLSTTSPRNVSVGKKEKKMQAECFQIKINNLKKGLKRQSLTAQGVGGGWRELFQRIFQRLFKPLFPLSFQRTRATVALRAGCFSAAPVTSCPLSGRAGARARGTAAPEGDLWP